MKAKKNYKDNFVGLTPKEYKKLENRHKKVLETIAKYKFNKILDIGCGDGGFSALLGKACGAREVYGVEISEKGVEMANKNGVKALKCDIDEENLPFEDAYFDAVFAGEVIEHLFDPDHFLNEIHRVLKVDGIFVLSTPNLASLYNRFALLFGFMPFPLSGSARVNIGRIYEPGCQQNIQLGSSVITRSSWYGNIPKNAQSLSHIRVQTLNSLKNLLKLHKFNIFEIKGVSADLPTLRGFKKLLKLVERITTTFPSISYRRVVVCQKIGT